MPEPRNTAMSIDPVCAFHGKRWSEHEGGRCLYCCVCFTTLAPSECWVDDEGKKWDVCIACARAEELAAAGVSVSGDSE